MQAVAGHLLRRFFGQAIHLAPELIAQFQQTFVKLRPLRPDLDIAVLLQLYHRMPQDGGSGSGGGNPVLLGPGGGGFRWFFLRSHNSTNLSKMIFLSPVYSSWPRSRLFESGRI